MRSDRLKYPPASVHVSGRHLIHACAHCKECDWFDDGQLTAAKTARRHVRETGHNVSVEQGIVYWIGVREKPWRAT